MEAWLPIMTSRNERVLFIDAFAGPGKYSDGEPGSPVVALNALIEHRAKAQIRSHISYYFIEKREDRSRHLEEVLGNLRGKLPPNCSYRVINSTFYRTLTNILDSADRQNARLPPVFVMIDPFGVSGTPMRVIGRIMKNSRSEVYVSFMSRDINRFSGHDYNEKHLDGLFGCPYWRQGIDMPDGKERIDFFYGLYERQLKANGARQVVRFDLYEGQQLVYAIFFGTKSLDGSDKMKQAIWKVDPFGTFNFRGSQLGQYTLGPSFANFDLLKEELLLKFGTQQWHKIEDVEDFVKSDATNFHSLHLKRMTLAPMEKDGKIDVERPPDRRRGSFASGTRIRFNEAVDSPPLHPQMRLI